MLFFSRTVLTCCFMNPRSSCLLWSSHGMSVQFFSSNLYQGLFSVSISQKRKKNLKQATWSRFADEQTLVFAFVTRKLKINNKNNCRAEGDTLEMLKFSRVWRSEILIKVGEGTVLLLSFCSVHDNDIVNRSRRYCHTGVRTEDHALHNSMHSLKRWFG